MTLSAGPTPRKSNGKRGVRVTYTYGPVTTIIDEDAGHARSFWHQLGVVLDQVDETNRVKVEAEAESTASPPPHG